MIAFDDRQRVAPAFACPNCGEDVVDELVWQDDETVLCATCDREYRPDDE